LLIALLLSGVIAYLIRRWPEQWGMSRPITFRSYHQISDELRHTNFFSSRLPFNTAIDDDVLYFVTDEEVIAISVDAGNLKWIADL
jgi:hypothetical protein